MSRVISIMLFTLFISNELFGQITLNGNLGFDHDGLRVELITSNEEIVNCSKDNSGTSCMSSALIKVKFTIVFTNKTGKNIMMQSQLFNLNITRAFNASISYNGCMCVDELGASQTYTHSVPISLSAITSSTGAQCLFPGERFVAIEYGWFHPFDVLEVDWTLPNNNPNSHYHWIYSICDEPDCREKIKSLEVDYQLCLTNTDYECAISKLNEIINSCTGECASLKPYYESDLANLIKKMNGGVANTNPTQHTGMNQEASGTTCQPCWNFLVEYGRKIDLHLNYCRGFGLDPMFTKEMTDFYGQRVYDYFEANLELLDKMTSGQLKHLEMIQSNYATDLSECSERVSKSDRTIGLDDTNQSNKTIIEMPLHIPPLKSGPFNNNQGIEIIEDTNFEPGNITNNNGNIIYGLPNSKTGSPPPSSDGDNTKKKSRKAKGRVTGM